LPLPFLSPSTLTVVAIAISVARVLFVSHHTPCCCHCPLCCHRHPSSDTLAAVAIALATLTIALFVAIAIALATAINALFKTIAIALATLAIALLDAIAIALATLTIALFVAIIAIVAIVRPPPSLP
jgi:hypothetical protein